jgi:hypothetical protein
VEAATAAPTAASPADPTAASPEAPTVTASLAASPAGETSDQIKAKYKAQLTDMESYYLGQMQKLYDQAIEAKRSGKSKGDIYNAYSQQVIDLEESSQAKVNELLLQMKNELTTGNLPTDSVNELRTTYYSELSKVQQSFTAKAKADFGI